ncbi:hypothetical protein TNIN_63821 [Trichonephila inaurata madagascariensis]|uniref:Uncharacterized protein n=1 Tax=Trichonephila inaurata madagascariensis TaxID=2747483 RepID=A0A8X6YTY6_9ARAC|nr:hypothetical protein TNIN_63821 [Trichonephila inaurata madagascariensis]
MSSSANCSSSNVTVRAYKLHSLSRIVQKEPLLDTMKQIHYVRSLHPSKTLIVWGLSTFDICLLIIVLRPSAREVVQVRLSLTNTMISRRKILSRSRDELNVDLGLEEDEDAWFTKERLFRQRGTHIAQGKPFSRNGSPQKRRALHLSAQTVSSSTPRIRGQKDYVMQSVVPLGRKTWESWKERDCSHFLAGKDRRQHPCPTTYESTLFDDSFQSPTTTASHLNVYVSGPMLSRTDDWKDYGNTFSCPFFYFEVECLLNFDEIHVFKVVVCYTSKNKIIIGCVVPNDYLCWVVGILL